MDAYLEEELYDIITYCIHNPNGSDFEVKKLRIEEIGKELYIDGGVDAMENIFSQYGTVQYRMNLDSSPSPYRISYYKY